MHVTLMAIVHGKKGKLGYEVNITLGSEFYGIEFGLEAIERAIESLGKTGYWPDEKI